MVFLLYGIKIKLALLEEVGWWTAWRCDDCKPFWSWVEIPTRMQIFFSLIFVRIHTNEFIQLLYELYSTNSYKMWFLYQFTYNCYTNCIVRIRTRCGFCTNSYIFLFELYSTNSYNEPRGRSPSTPPAPTRPHPAAPTLGYTRLPRPLEYTRLPPPVRVRSWGGWVRNGIKITIRKSGLYDLTCVAYSTPFRPA